MRVRQGLTLLTRCSSRASGDLSCDFALNALASRTQDATESAQRGDGDRVFDRVRHGEACVERRMRSRDGGEDPRASCRGAWIQRTPFLWIQGTRFFMLTNPQDVG